MPAGHRQEPRRRSAGLAGHAAQRSVHRSWSRSGGVARGARVLILDGAHLEIGHETGINFSTAITCVDHISIGSNCTISWNCDIFDGNMHELVVAGVPRPRTRPVHVGDHVWIGSGATVLGATIGAGAVVATGSVVTADVPGEVVVAGNPARVVRKEVTWRL